MCVVDVSRLALLLVAASLSSAGVIEDAVTNSDGTAFRGWVAIQLSCPAACPGPEGEPRLWSLPVVQGALRVSLPATSCEDCRYSVTYLAFDGAQRTESWAVPAGDRVLRIRDVLREPPPSLRAISPQSVRSITTQIPEVNGLPEELDLRARKGPSYQGPRAAIINAAGEVDAAGGDPENCIRVDGTSGPCGSGALASFIDGEVPAGTMNGVNAAFTIAKSPDPSSSLKVFRNGVLQKQTADYTITGTSIQFVPASIPQTGDLVQAFYRSATASGLPPQVLCNAAGSVTSATALSSLGTCVLPANLLQPGDRVDILVEYSHEGAAIDFAFEVRWGSTVVAARTAGAANTSVLAQSHQFVAGGTSRWSSQSWGAGLPFTAAAGTAANDLASPITIDFLGQLTSVTQETITLRHFSVIRYPAAAGPV